jgi:hypothetical protein
MRYRKSSSGQAVYTTLSTSSLSKKAQDRDVAAIDLFISIHLYSIHLYCMHLYSIHLYSIHCMPCIIYYVQGVPKRITP